MLAAKSERTIYFLQIDPLGRSTARPEVVIVFTHVVRTLFSHMLSVRPTFQNLAKQNRFSENNVHYTG